MDDEPLVLSGVSMLLESIGHTVDQATHGDEVLEKVRAGSQYDLAILDLTVRQGRGADEIAVPLGKLSPQMRLVVTSGYDGDDVLANYGNHGFHGSLPKPFTLDELRTAIRRLFTDSPETGPGDRPNL
ncbi:MAG: response regulator [Planctomycetaceae bacterium]|nr:response regulator [Planctomycetaceae bacterium]